MHCCWAADLGTWCCTIVIMIDYANVQDLCTRAHSWYACVDFVHEFLHTLMSLFNMHPTSWGPAQPADTTVSLGVATHTPSGGQSPNYLVYSLNIVFLRLISDTSLLPTKRTGEQRKYLVPPATCNRDECLFSYSPCL